MRKLIAEILGVETFTGKTPGYLGARQTALLRILAELPGGERAALDAEVKRIERQGNPEDVKRR